MDDTQCPSASEDDKSDVGSPRSPSAPPAPSVASELSHHTQMDSSPETAIAITRVALTPPDDCGDCSPRRLFSSVTPSGNDNATLDMVALFSPVSDSEYLAAAAVPHPISDLTVDADTPWRYCITALPGDTDPPAGSQDVAAGSSTGGTRTDTEPLNPAVRIQSITHDADDPDNGEVTITALVAATSSDEEDLWYQAPAIIIRTAFIQTPRSNSTML